MARASVKLRRISLLFALARTRAHAHTRPLGSDLTDRLIPQTQLRVIPQHRLGPFARGRGSDRCQGARLIRAAHLIRACAADRREGGARHRAWVPWPAAREAAAAGGASATAPKSPCLLTFALAERDWPT